MSLKINYLDTKKSSNKNKAIFVHPNTKMSGFKGEFDDKINQKLVNFFKKNKSTKDNKIISLNQDFDQKLIIKHQPPRTDATTTTTSTTPTPTPNSSNNNNNDTNNKH